MLRNFFIAFILAYTGNAFAFTLEGTVWNSVKKVDPILLYAIALTESRQPDRTFEFVRPWPFAINYQGKGYYFDSRAEAMDKVNEILATGNRSVDVGLMQINLRWNGHRVEDVADLFSIYTSIKVAEDILSEALASAPDDLVLGIGRYHSWDEAKARNYGNLVLKTYNALRRL